MKPGHVAEYCRTSPWCWICKVTTHYPGQCEHVAATVCATCGETGHDSAMCTLELECGV